ncbi:hypothetical protein D3C87_1536300 [compost metagenome]
MEDSAKRPRVMRKLFCMRAIAESKRPSSSRPSTITGSRRSLLAILSATAKVLSKGPVRLRVNAQAKISVATIASAIMTVAVTRFFTYALTPPLDMLCAIRSTFRLRSSTWLESFVTATMSGLPGAARRVMVSSC